MKWYPSYGETKPKKSEKLRNFDLDLTLFNDRVSYKLTISEILQFLGGGSTSKFLIFLSLSYLKNLGFADSGTSHQMVQWPRRSPRTLVFLSSIQLTKGFLRFYRVLEYQLLVVVVDLPCCSTPLRARLSWPFVLTRQNQNKRSMVTSHHQIWKSRQQLLPSIKKMARFYGLLPTIRKVTSHH